MCIYIYIHLTIYKYTVCQTALVNTKRAYNWTFSPSMMVLRRFWLDSSPHRMTNMASPEASIPTWTPVSAEAPSIGRAPEGTALLERCLGCLAVGMTTGVPAAPPRLIKLGLPAHGIVVARDQSFPAQGEPGIIWWDCCATRDSTETHKQNVDKETKIKHNEIKDGIFSIRMSSQYSLSRYICRANLSIVYSNSLILPE